MGQKAKRQCEQTENEKGNGTFDSSIRDDNATKKPKKNLRSSLLRNMKKKKEDPDSEIKWTFWKDLEFLRLSLEMDEGNQDNVEWSNEETGKFLLYSYRNSYRHFY